MEPRELQERISAFPRWHYRFEFEQGIATRPPRFTPFMVKLAPLGHRVNS